MTTEKKTDGNPPSPAPVTYGVPPVVEQRTEAGPGEVVVISPTGFRSVVSEDAVDSLKPQGYRVA